MPDADLVALLEAKFQTLTSKIDDLHRLEQHDLCAVNLRFDTLLNFFEKAVENTKENFRRTDSVVAARFDALGAQVQSHQHSLMPRLEVETMVREWHDISERTDSRLKILETANANFSGKAWAIGAIITLINVAGTWAGLFIRLGH